MVLSGEYSCRSMLLQQYKSNTKMVVCSTRKKFFRFHVNSMLAADFQQSRKLKFP